MKVEPPPEWVADALCAHTDTDPDIFFPNRGEPVRAALLVCQACPVRAECLAWALDERIGIWGGTTPNQRARMRKEAA